ncbi:hypothetical protein FGO68_gene7337 [Halteria grandinella]|uniref:Uncharacterized protein n=1 Tax=Halteria grandinella TaxID=5974 RepID=A0A8J8SYV4_HALGN|nr:hypothetical protein FGO68_gene7337 [Halteria grandinella]
MLLPITISLLLATSANAEPWPKINTHTNYLLDLTYHRLVPSENRTIPLPHDHTTVLMNGDKGRIRLISQFPSGNFGVLGDEKVLDFTHSREQYRFSFGGVCKPDMSLAAIPINFTQMVQDMFNETKRFNIYDTNATYNFDNSTPLWVFHTRKIFSADMGRFFFYFEQATGDLKWIWIEGMNNIIRVGKGGMVRQEFSDADFDLGCEVKTEEESSLHLGAAYNQVLSHAIKLYEKYQRVQALSAFEQ